uniref:Extracellular globin n=1 Tax=Platynereis dumerilii TaxID=6359 RepID=A0A7T8CLZ9_PLADU|nr:extracellular globin Egb_A1a [Platynereis dumerilii]
MNGITVFLILAMASASLADDCTQLDMIKVKHQWAEVYGVESNRQEFGLAVFKRFFVIHPDRSLFVNVHGDNVYSPEFQAHVARVLAGVDILISSMDQEAIFKAAQKHYADFHKSKFGEVPLVEFGTAMRDVLPKYVGLRNYDNDSWSRCYAYITSKVE